MDAAWIPLSVHVHDHTRRREECDFEYNSTTLILEVPVMDISIYTGIFLKQVSINYPDHSGLILA